MNELQLAITEELSRRQVDLSVSCTIQQGDIGREVHSCIYHDGEVFEDIQRVLSGEPGSFAFHRLSFYAKEIVDGLLVKITIKKMAEL